MGLGGGGFGPLRDAITVGGIPSIQGGRTPTRIEREGPLHVLRGEFHTTLKGRRSKKTNKKSNRGKEKESKKKKPGRKKKDFLL